MGCFRLVYKHFKATAVIENGKLYVTSKKTKEDAGRDRDLIVPDKKRWA
jgi:hypothetical protein